MSDWYAPMTFGVLDAVPITESAVVSITDDNGALPEDSTPAWSATAAAGTYPPGTLVVVRPVDPDDIATGITRVLAADQSTRERWRAHAQMLMSTKYSRDAASRLLEQLLDEVVAGVPPRSAKA